MNEVKYHTKLGFTLLELLLVILIIGVIASAAILFYQTETVSSKIAKTANQMEQITQAAAAYYVDNSCWPGSAQNTNCKQCTSTPPDFNQYLNLGTTSNPFGQGSNFSYSYQPEPQNCKKFQVFSGELPTPANNPNAILNRVIASLPSGAPATIPTPPNQAMTEIVVPSTQPVIIPNYIFKHVQLSQVLQNGSSIGYTITCPIGWQGAGFVVPVQLNPYDWITNGINCSLITFPHGPGSYAISTLSAPMSCQGQGTITCTYNVSYTANTFKNVPGCPWETVGAGNVQFLEVSYCINPNPQGKKRAPVILF